MTTTRTTARTEADALDGIGDAIGDALTQATFGAAHIIERALTRRDPLTAADAPTVADALLAIARAISKHADATEHLASAAARIAGGDTDTEPGGLEALGMTLNGGRTGENWPSIRAAIAEGFGELAEAIRDTARPDGEPAP